METIVRHLRIHGRVQGVGYRATMTQQAQRLGVNGWVRNRLDGTVEAVVAGTPQAVQALIEWARQGPALARVDDVQVLPAPPQPDLPPGCFEQRPTA